MKPNQSPFRPCYLSRSLRYNYCCQSRARLPPKPAFRHGCRHRSVRTANPKTQVCGESDGWLKELRLRSEHGCVTSPTLSLVCASLWWTDRPPCQEREYEQKSSRRKTADRYVHRLSLFASGRADVKKRVYASQALQESLQLPRYGNNWGCVLFPHNFMGETRMRSRPCGDSVEQSATGNTPRQDRERQGTSTAVGVDTLCVFCWLSFADETGDGGVRSGNWNSGNNSVIPPPHHV